MSSERRFDYTTVGHVTVDVLADGTRQAGGAALYGALQAARLGLRAQILTRGVSREIEALLAPFGGELELSVIEAPQTTTLLTAGVGENRTQRVLSWAGPIELERPLDCSILHLAPVARETPLSWSGGGDFVGLTPQGLARAWEPTDGEVRAARPDASAERLAARCDAIVLSRQELAGCAALLAAARAGGALVAVTAGGEPVRLIGAGAEDLELEMAPLERVRDDLGAGDVFAAALFVALSEGQTPERAARFAGAAAAVRLGGHGPDAIGDRDALRLRLADTR